MNSNRIRDVWSSNLEQEIAALRDTVDQFPYIFIKSELPGIVARPIGNFKTLVEFRYQTMRCNVELLKVIQMGFTLCDADGNFAPDACVWQFNFKFDLEEDMYEWMVGERLQRGGFDFTRHQEQGINPNDFAELLITSGLVLFDDVVWVGHACQNDFGYLLKILTAAALPTLEADFRELLAIWFPHIYDIKFIMKATRPVHLDLQELADEFGIQPLSQAPGSGSGSHLTASVYTKIRNGFFGGQDPDPTKFDGQLHPSNNRYGFTPTALSNSPTIGMGGHSAANLHAQYAVQQAMYHTYR